MVGLLIERVTGKALDWYVANNVFAPLGMKQTMYRPPKALYYRVAPTGIWRGHPSRGVVNDQNAVRLRGAAGHAGVFSTGSDLARYAQMWMNDGALPTGRFVSPSIIRQFLTPGPTSGTRLLGWDSPDTAAPPPSVFGTLLTRSAYGHTGWTGTEVWIDPERDLFVVFLTNRSYDPQVGHSIRELRAVRARLADAAVRAVPTACQAVATAAC